MGLICFMDPHETLSAYKYWNIADRDRWELLFECEAYNMETADMLFLLHKSFNPRNDPYIIVACDHPNLSDIFRK